MNRSRALSFRAVRLAVWLGLLAGLLVVGTGSVAAATFQLNWSQIGFVDGTSSLQTFTNVGGSGVTMTTEFRVVDASFNDLGLYVPGTSQPNQGMPKVSDTLEALLVRDINQAAFPAAGYIRTQITFSDEITINDLWLEPFYHWSEQGILKHQALQAFDGQGNAVVPVSWQTYGGSTLVVEQHPANGQPWLRSDFTTDQTTYSGATDVNYGSQRIKELHWYSWGEDVQNGSLTNLIGSTYLGSFTFSVVPTAVALVSVASLSPAQAAAGTAPLLLLVVVLSLATLAVSWRRRQETGER
jgi:hypothetical protein